MRDFTLKCFGVADGCPSADLNHSSYLYRWPDAAFLIDCGESISRSYKASGLSYDLVDGVVLSHLHFDHVGGFFMLIQSFWLEGRKKPLVVHAPKDGILPLRRMLKAAGIFDEELPFRITFEPLQPRVAFAFANVQLTPFPTSHLARFKATYGVKYPGEYAAFSFLIERDGSRIGHTADVGAIADLDPLVEKPLDLLVCELAHMAPDELFDYLRGRKIRRVAFVHLVRSLRGEIDSVAARAKERLQPMGTLFPTDGDTLTD